MRFISKKYLSWLALLFTGMGALVSGFFFPSGQEEGFRWTHFDGFYAILGFLGCITLVFSAKWLGDHWLRRKENYYD